MKLIKDLGIMFTSDTKKYKAHFAIYECIECKHHFKANMAYMNANRIKNCGCTVICKCNKEMSNHRLYQTWKMMFHRCNNPKRKDFKHYGGRGIKVCDEWKSFNKFIEDMYPTFQEGLTLDRIDNDGNYEKSNCQWANQSLQISKTRILKPIGYRGSYYHKIHKLWFAKLMINGKNIHIGSFKTSIEAAKARDKYIIENNLPHTLNFKREGLVNDK